MRFILRSLSGLLMLTITLALLGYAGWSFYGALTAEAPQRGEPSVRERAFIARVDSFEAQTAHINVTGYGLVESARRLELRAKTGGELVEMAPDFRDGAHVKAGELLFATNPADPSSALSLATVERDRAQAELDDAQAEVGLAEKELEAARSEQTLRETALERQKGLLQRAVGSEVTVENAALALAQAQQSVISREQALTSAHARVEFARITLRQAGIDLEDARRNLRDTRIYAPFTGSLSEVDAVLGRLVNANEKLGVLLDPTALEVRIRVSNAQFARLIDEKGALEELPVTIRLRTATGAVETEGTLMRIGAEASVGVGRTLYAVIDPERSAAFRPDDFVSVQIHERPLENVAIVPSEAITADGRMLVMGEDDRLEEITVSIIRRQGFSVVVGDVPWGRDYVTERTPQLGAGIKVRPERVGEAISVDEETNERQAANASSGVKQ